MAYSHHHHHPTTNPHRARLYFTRAVCFFRNGGRGALWHPHHRYKTLSAIVSLVLLLANLYVWHNGCENFQSPLYLQHGYLPVFPHHLYPPYNASSSSSSLSQQSSSISSSSSSSFSRNLDHYLYSHVIHDSLAQLVPPALHLIHCDRGPFTFTHYSSALAAFKLLKPSAMFIHIKQEPELDPDGYYQFLPDLLRDIPILVKVKLKERDACEAKGAEQTAAFVAVIGGTGGGIAVSTRVVLSPSEAVAYVVNKNISVLSLESDRHRTSVVSLASHVVPSLFPSFRALRDSLSSSPDGSYKTPALQCVNPATFSAQPDKAHACLYLPEDIFPYQIFTANSDFARLVRWASYGSTRPLTPDPSPQEVVPNIVHYVWLGRRRLDYFTFLSFLSSLHVLEAEAVYVHGEAPYGELWDYFQDEPRLKLIRRDFPESVYGTPIEKFVSHASDYLRADVLLRYGGVYADTDVIFLNKLPADVRRFEASACPDWPKTGAFPDVFNMGVLAAAPGASFLRYFLESYRWYLDGDWSYNAIHIPYKVYEKQPHTLNVARHLQVLCAEDKCHATWVSGYKVDGVDHLDGKTFDWRSEALAIHWTHPDPPEFSCQETLLASHSIPADMGKMVLRKAKIIP